MRRKSSVIAMVVALVAVPALADDVLYRYEGDVLPYDESAGWLIADPCEPPCSELLEDGHFVLQWPESADLANYAYRIAEPPDAPPPTLWVEWQYRSNHPFFGVLDGCDGRFSLKYGGIHDVVYMNGDFVVSFEGSDFVTGLDMEESHTYRFESLDGIDYRISVDGLVFIVDSDTGAPNGYHTLQFSGQGGCGAQQIPDMKNEWDFVRYGTIDFGESIIASDPPSGYLDPAIYSDLDRFTVTFDSANYVYIDDITVEVTGGIAPTVTQTRRRETDDVDTVEVVLDRALPTGQRTRFIFDDGQTTNVLNYCLGMELSCGDGCCDVQEECPTCTQDCHECGDGCCSPGETFDNCPTDCPQIPALSDWGMTILSLLTLTAGSMILSRRHSLSRGL